MYRVLTICACIVIPSITSLSLAGEPPAQKEDRKYKHNFEGQDLTKRDFSNQNLDDSNFEDANLTIVNFQGASLRNCNFRGATLKSTSFFKADLTGSDFREAKFSLTSLYMSTLNKTDFFGVDLNGANMTDLKIREANFRGTRNFGQIYGSDFYQSDFRGADLTKAYEYSASFASFRKGKYDQHTRFYSDFNAKERGLVFVESKEEEDSKDEKSEGDKSDEEKEEKKKKAPADDDSPKTSPKAEPKSKSNRASKEAANAQFQQLDGNADGVLSGNEVKGFSDRDSDQDGEVTLAEFLAGSGG